MSESVNHGCDGNGNGTGRTPGTGRFAPGNKLSHGNANNRRMHHLRARLLATATDADIEAVGKKLVALARDGDVAAAKVWLDHVAGRAPQAIELSGPDGEPLGLDWARVQSTLLAALARFPEARLAVAMKLKGLADDAAAVE